MTFVCVFLCSEICNGIFGLDFAKRSKGRDSIEDKLKVHTFSYSHADECMPGII